MTSHSDLAWHPTVRFLSRCKGVGKTLAERIVSTLGPERVDAVLTENPGQLNGIAGLGAARVQTIMLAWRSRLRRLDNQAQLYEWGLTVREAAAAADALGDDTLVQVRQDPYILTAFAPFAKVDRLALNLCLSPADPVRLRAGIRDVLAERSKDGHTITPARMCVDSTAALLKVGIDPLLSVVLEGAIELQWVLLRDGEWVQPQPDTPLDELVVSLPEHYWSDLVITHVTRRLLSRPPEISAEAAQEIALRTAESLGLVLDEHQIEAVAGCLQHRVAAITGGPGRGKSRVLKVLVYALMGKPFGCHVVLGAPTGKAARRLKEATGFKAYTLHQLSGFRHGPQDFEGQGVLSSLAADALIIDECAMVDSVLLKEVLSCLTACYDEFPRVILVGDVDQLQPINAGTPFRDLLAAEAIPTFRLVKSYRQGSGSILVAAADRVIAGEHHPDRPIAPALSRPGTFDLAWVPADSPEQILAETLRTLDVLAAKGFDPIHDVQVLVPIRRGELGLEAINPLIQSHLVGPGGQAVRFGTECFHVGDKVVNTYNDYEKNVMNGDIGLVQAVASSPVPHVTVEFEEGRKVTYTDAEIARLEPAFALTVHKFQGSECPGVIIPVWWYGEMMHRSLLYTAMTRAQKLAVFIGPERAISAAVRLDLRGRRETGLSKVLSSPIDESLPRVFFSKTASGSTFQPSFFDW